MRQNCDRNVKQLRKPENIPKDTLQAIRTVTSNMETLPVGTFKYSLFKYPGDIDIFEPIESCCTFNVAKISAANEVQSIVRRVLNTDNILFVEFKAGYDERFNIYTGVLDEMGGFVDFYPFMIKRDLINLYNAGLLKDETMHKLLSLLREDSSINEILEFNEILRNLRVVRWTSEDVLKGYKMLPGNYKLYLDVALTQGSIVKLDTIAYVDERYTELTNFLLISQTDKYGNKKILSEELGNYQQSLLSDVHKYYDKNTLKAVKRYWMYLAYKNKICDLSAFKELFSSKIALYSQISSDIEVAIMLLKSNLNYKPDLLFRSLGNRLQLLDDVCINSENLYHDVNSNDPLVLAANLQILCDCVKNYVTEETKNWLYENNIDILASK